MVALAHARSLVAEGPVAGVAAVVAGAARGHEDLAVGEQRGDVAAEVDDLTVVVEAALLIEAGIAEKLDGLVVAFCEPAQQMARLRARGMSEIEAKRGSGAHSLVAKRLSAGA